jgi:hypothetical protein
MNREAWRIPHHKEGSYKPKRFRCLTTPGRADGFR